MAANEPTVLQMKICVDREIELRRKHYPRWVKRGHITQAQADREIMLMEAVAMKLVWCEAAERELAFCGSKVVLASA